jgi:hypothetical protein
MEITLLNRRNYNLLKNIQEKYPHLTFQNEGYQYLKAHVKLTDKDKQAIRICYKILNKSIHHLNEFNNFKISKDGLVLVRVQYNWDPDHRGFTGVGYVPLECLRHGFTYKEEGPIFYQDDITVTSSVEERIKWMQGLNTSGYAGINANGNIVDRREFPDATAIQANPMFGIVEPKTNDYEVST